jgi:GT2 family glycosyltransferase
VTEAQAGQRPKLSVVLPCRNGAATIAGQLEALAAQSWDGPWEVVVADNGSTDESMRIVEGYRDRFPELRVVDASERPGLAPALNAGVRGANGDAVAFVNDDDEVAEGWLAAMARALEQHDLVAGLLEYDRLNQPWAIDVRGRPQEDGLAEWGFLDYLPFACCATIGVRRPLHEAVGGFDEGMVPAGEDMDYCWRLQLAGAGFHLVPDAVTHYRLRHSIRSLFRQGLAYGEGHALAYRKHRRLGLPRAERPWRRGVRAWLGLVKRLALVRSKTQLALFVWHVGLRAGLIRGSVKHRVVFL